MNRFWFVVAVILGFGSEATPLIVSGPVIRHEPLQTVPTNHHPVIEATIESDVEIRSAKLYFRAAQEQDFYYVEMTRNAGTDTFNGILPRPDAGTDEIEYYIEAQDETFESATTSVSQSETDDDAIGLAYVGEDPGILIGTARSGLSAYPPGFQPSGIAGFINAIGASSAAASGASSAGSAAAAGASGGGGGGLGAGTAVALGGAAAGAGTVGYLASSGGDEAPTADTPPIVVAGGPAGPGQTPALPPTTPGGPGTPPTPSPPVPPSVTACFTTSPNPPVITEGESIRLDATCSNPSATAFGARGSAITYEWDLGDGRIRTGRVINPVFRSAGQFDVTLRVGDDGTVFTETTVVEVLETPRGADVSVRLLNFGPFINLGQFFQTIRVENVGPAAARNLSLTFEQQFEPHQFSSDFCRPARVDIVGIPSSGRFSCSFTADDMTCMVATMPIGVTSVEINLSLVPTGCQGVSRQRAIVALDNDPQTGNNNFSVAAELVNPSNLTDSDFPRNAQTVTTFSSFMNASPRDQVTGQLVLNRAGTLQTMNGASLRHEVRSLRGKNVIDAQVLGAGAIEGDWRFDFTGARGFVPGSLKAESGDVIVLDASTIVFRLSEAPGQPMRFSFRSSP